MLCFRKSLLKLIWLEFLSQTQGGSSWKQAAVVADRGEGWQAVWRAGPQARGCWQQEGGSGMGRGGASPGFLCGWGRVGAGASGPRKAAEVGCRD